MTLAEAKKAVKAVSCTLRKLDGEYQVKPAAAKWTTDSVYYTNDLADAVGTAIHMGRPRRKRFKTRRHRAYKVSR